MNFKDLNLESWLAKNRLFLWWLVYIPLMAVILIINRKQLGLTVNDLSNLLISPQYKIFNSALIIVLTRVTLVAVGIVIILVCLLFPLFRISKEGVQWTKELEEELAEVSGQITGEEISGLVKEESLRWSLIHGWLKLEENRRLEPELLLRELLGTLWDAFPNQKISLTQVERERKWGLFHPLLAKLTLAEPGNIYEEDTSFSLKLEFSDTSQLLLHVYSDSGGFSPIDEKFIMVLGEIFLREVKSKAFTTEALSAYFERVPLTVEEGPV
ncbi:MAG: hypothetical protein ACM3X9_05055 [Bacillota bacterium]